MEIEIGWKLMLTLAWLGLCAIAVVKSVYESSVDADIKTLFKDQDN